MLGIFGPRLQEPRESLQWAALSDGAAGLGRIMQYNSFASLREQIANANILRLRICAMQRRGLPKAFVSISSVFDEIR